MSQFASVAFFFFFCSAKAYTEKQLNIILDQVCLQELWLNILSVCGHSTMLYRGIGTLHWGLQQITEEITQSVITEPQITPPQPWQCTLSSLRTKKLKCFNIIL